jgi:hypothetical protein
MFRSLSFRYVVQDHVAECHVLGWGRCNTMVISEEVYVNRRLLVSSILDNCVLFLNVGVSLHSAHQIAIDCGGEQVWCGRQNECALAHVRDAISGVYYRASLVLWELLVEDFGNYGLVVLLAD